MESPEYHRLIKELTKASLSGLISPGMISSDRRSGKKGLEKEIDDMKRLIDRNDLSPEICEELRQELVSPDRQDNVSQPLRECYRKVQDDEIENMIGRVSIPEPNCTEMLSSLAKGENLLIRGMADNKKLHMAQAIACTFYKENNQYHKLCMLSSKCTKRSSGLEISFDRRRYLDGRIQLGYIGQAMLLAESHPKRLYVLILDEVDTMDGLEAFEETWDMLKHKNAEKLIARSTMIRNRTNFILIVTRNMENDTPNNSMDNLGLRALFHGMDFYDAEQIKKRKSRKMI